MTSDLFQVIISKYFFFPWENCILSCYHPFWDNGVTHPSKHGRLPCFQCSLRRPIFEGNLQFHPVFHRQIIQEYCSFLTSNNSIWTILILNVITVWRGRTRVQWVTTVHKQSQRKSHASNVTRSTSYPETLGTNGHHCAKKFYCPYSCSLSNITGLVDLWNCSEFSGFFFFRSADVKSWGCVLYAGAPYTRDFTVLEILGKQLHRLHEALMKCMSLTTGSSCIQRKLLKLVLVVA